MRVFMGGIALAFLSTSPTVGADPTPRPHGPEAAAAGLSAEALGSLDAAMQKQVDSGRVSGVIGVIGRHGKIGYSEAFGRRVIEKDLPMTEDTLFRIYSMTKPIVAVAAMTLWEEGKFGLDDPIANHLPEWKGVKVLVKGEVVPADTPVTPRHLMTHSAGLSYDRRGLELGDDATLREFSESLAARPLEFQPGSDYRYGYSIDVLGRYIEAVEGKPLDVVVKERVFDKLGMADTEFWVRDPAGRGRVAHVYTRSEDGELKTLMGSAPVMAKPARMMGGQGLVSTAGDYARFCQMLVNKGELDGRRVLKTDTVELMFRNHLKSIGKVYGLGGMVDEKGAYWWGGAAGTKFRVDTRGGYYYVFMIQRWGYEPPTFGLFSKAVEKALVPE